MEDMASPSVLPGPSHVPCWHPAERQLRKTGTHDIFQGLNLRQLRRLFQVAGEQDAEQRARMVWGGGRRGGSQTDMGDRDAEEEEEEVRAEVEIGLAQALVGLRVRARTRSGIRAEGHRDGVRRVRPSTQHRNGAASSLGHPVDVPDGDTEVDLSGEIEAKSGAERPSAETQGDGEPSEITYYSRGAARERDPERHLHRIRH